MSHVTEVVMLQRDVARREVLGKAAGTLVVISFKSLLLMGVPGLKPSWVVIGASALAAATVFHCAWRLCRL